jgi:molecular chaperone GrpE
MRREVLKDAERGRRAIFEAILEVVDNLDRAIEAGRTTHDGQALLGGVELVRRQLLARLESFGVTRVEALGLPFDPLRHEAMSSVPTESPDEDGKVVGVMSPGYAIGAEVLRPAMVAVASFTAAPSDAPPA